MTNQELVTMAKKIATDYKTLYVKGCFGAPLTGGSVDRYCNNNTYNKNRSSIIRAEGNQTPPVYGFDCVCLIKGILWGWDGSADKVYGGAAYESNGVPDIGTETMIERCIGATTDFKSILPGEMLWMQGHAGIYIGDGLAVECTPAWDNDVQITAVANIGSKSGYHARTWTKHGKLPWVSYETGGSSSGGGDNMIGYPTVVQTLRKGSKGDAVKNLQLVLMHKFGYQKELQAAGGADGDFGTATETAVKDFQRVFQLDADGIVGERTASRLNADFYKLFLITDEIAENAKISAEKMRSKLDAIKKIIEG